MKQFLTSIFFLVLLNFCQAQFKVAILDFENTSGKSEYDAFGKAISSMLITDLKNNIHPKKADFFERSQLNKLLDEQKLQKSKNFDSKTAVEFGKLSGVNYVFVGSVFVINNNCNITSKLIDVQTSKIILTKDVSGNIEAIMQLKTQLAELLAQQLNSPIVLDPSYKLSATPVSTLNQYGKILTAIDQGDAEKAEKLRSVFEESEPSFKYFKDIKDEIDELKKQVEKNTADIEVLNKSGGRIVNATKIDELINNITNPNSNYEDRKKYMLLILEHETTETGKIISSFNNICNQPSGIELLMSFNMNDGKATEKTLKLYENDLDFIATVFANENLNKNTVSNYIFYYLRVVADFAKKDKGLSNDIKIKSKKLATTLLKYNQDNSIPKYDYNTFGGDLMYSFRFENDKDLNVQHLIDLLN